MQVSIEGEIRCLDKTRGIYERVFEKGIRYTLVKSSEMQQLDKKFTSKYGTDDSNKVMRIVGKSF